MFELKCLVFLYLFINCAENLETLETGCQISSIPEYFLTCKLNGNDISTENLTSSIVPKDTTCETTTDSRVTQLRCNGTSWETLGEKDRKEETKGRNKRSIGFGITFEVHFHVSREKREHAFIKLYADSERYCQSMNGKLLQRDVSFVCVYVVKVTAEPLRIYAQASWSEPKQYKMYNLGISTLKRNGKAPFSYFPEHRTTVSYIAKCRHDIVMSYVVYIDVTVVRCPSIEKVKNGYFQCSPVSEFIYGARCIFGCYQGFRLQGTAGTECQRDGHWKPAKQPTCEPLTCPDPPVVVGAGKADCTNGVNFRSICSYKCSTHGFDMPPGVSSTIVCTDSSTWRKHGEPKCIDVEAPLFSFCPSIVLVGTDSGLNSTTADWKTPEVMDNSGSAHLSIEKGKPPGSRFVTGIHDIIYNARDDGGNLAHSKCSFNVMVKEISCHKLYPTPWVNFQCPDGYRRGSFCNVTCDPGKKMAGTDNVGCEKNPAGLFGSWKWVNGTQTTCKSTDVCVPLVTPANGAVVCDNWEGGKFCQVQCTKGTEMSSVNLNKLYVCKSKGVWSESQPDVKTCRAVRQNRARHFLGVNMTYLYNDDCTNVTSQHQIADNFIEALQTHVYKADICPNSSECESHNVQISCDNSTTHGTSFSNETNVNMTIGIIIKLPLDSTEDNTVESIEKQYIELLDKVENTVKEHEKFIFNETTVSQQMFKNNGLQTECDEGSVKSEQNLNCVDCPEGTFYKKTSDGAVCRACAKGTYQDEEAQTRCKPCPITRTTQGVGSSSIEDCEDACYPGNFGPDGLFPCSPCEMGYYQPMFGQNKCLPCPLSTTTTIFGAPDLSDCKDFDISVLHEEDSSIKLTVRESLVLNDFTLGVWLKLHNNSEDTSEGENTNVTVVFFNEHEEDIWSMVFKRTNLSYNTSSEPQVPVIDDRWHHIILRSISCDIVVSVDDIFINIDTYSTVCGSLITKSIVIEAGNGTRTSLSQLNIWHGNHIFSEEQKCFSQEIGSALSWKKFEEAEMIDAYITAPSQCDDTDDCADSPCKNGACRDALNDFECDCIKGFKGKRCEVNIDDCVLNVCLNNATCMDAINNYSCICPDHYTGSLCEIKMVDGNWNEWGNWSECSTTCGDGTMKRNRLCNNPSPDNGGEYCEGESHELTDCNNPNCTVCPPLESVDNGYLECKNDSEDINCTLSCHHGYDFDIEPLRLYYCGSRTFNEWNFESDENLYRRLPKCVEIQMPSEMSMRFTAKYRDLYFDDVQDVTGVTAKINSVVQNVVASVSDVQSDSIEIKYDGVTCCDFKALRRRRSEELAGFDLQIIGRSDKEGSKNITKQVEDVYNGIHQAVYDGNFMVDIENNTFDLDLNLTNFKGEVVCRPGQMRINHYCVPCGPGAYLDVDICKPCPIGTYQGKLGQVECIQCPPQKLTVGIRSTSITECEVQMLMQVKEDDLTVVWTLSGSVLALAILIIVVVLICKRFRSRSGNFTLGISGNMEMYLPTKGPDAFAKQSTLPSLLSKNDLNVESHHDHANVTGGNEHSTEEISEETPIIGNPSKDE